MEGADFAKIEAESKDIIQKLKDLNSSENWKANGDKPCQMFKIQIENRVASKGITVVNFPYEKVLAFFNLPDPTPRINEMCVNYKILHEDHQKGFKVIYLEMKAVWPVANRDFVVVSARSDEGDVTFMGTKSCSYPHPEVNKVVRGELFVGGYILEKIDEKSTRVTYISDSDAKGNIPQMVKNTVSAKQGGVVSKVEEAIKKAGI